MNDPLLTHFRKTLVLIQDEVPLSGDKNGLKSYKIKAKGIGNDGSSPDHFHNRVGGHGRHKHHHHHHYHRQNNSPQQ